MPLGSEFFLSHSFESNGFDAVVTFQTRFIRSSKAWGDDCVGCISNYCVRLLLAT